ncbi:MAG: MBL fold metallo-hydrolase [Gemmatales bacterium]|nr:MBL fold metallo-hydrolase [Gemmatales bacterium]MDW8175435.1 MBL fold metallo-hydrolase [Gemmatales bacterium]
MRRRLTFLGTATSSGVPLLGCCCATCTSNDPRNRRLRSAALVTLPQGRILIDTPPEIRYQLLNVHATESLTDLPIRAVLYTHHHADHLFGFDDLRGLCRILRGALPVFCRQDTARFIRAAFPYAFTPHAASGPAGQLPRVQLQVFEDYEPFEVLGQAIMPVAIEHNVPVTAFRFDNLAYCTDVGAIPERSWSYLENLDVLILSCLRPHKPYVGHLTLEQALEIIARLRPRRAYLTHLGHEMEYNAIAQQLPPNVELAYDGLSLEF